ncbi:hypothetical protein VKT23_017298 [Stygiomarasmius scandens]|uniref:Uncharacterized protein n=1 Tax=Marasmiellus scandens TaxID=2682957 RepID=A0ABR1IVM5_9AGAR
MALGIRARRFLSYSADWAIAIVIALFAQFYLQQFQQMPSFDLTDTSIQYSIREQTIPVRPFVVASFHSINTCIPERLIGCLVSTAVCAGNCRSLFLLL